MKLGSIVGIVLSCLIIIAGVVMCLIGVSEAKESNQFLFTQIDDNGTFYSQKIAEGTTKLDIGIEDADVTIKGGAEETKIEFYNFNPNLYSFTATPNVVTFNEVQSISSLVNIWENGFTFKGLRYLLDARNFDFDDHKKSIIISIADDSEIVSISIEGENSEVRINDLSFSGDIVLNVNEGKVHVNALKTSSSLNVRGKNVNATIRASEIDILDFDVDTSNLFVDTSVFTSSQVTVDNGRVDFYVTTPLDNALLSVSSDTGGLLVNGKPQIGVLSNEPLEYDMTLKIKCMAAGVNFEYPVGKTEANKDKNN